MKRRAILAVTTAVIVGGSAWAASADDGPSVTSPVSSPTSQQVCLFFAYGPHHTDQQPVCIDL